MVFRDWVVQATDLSRLLPTVEHFLVRTGTESVASVYVLGRRERGGKRSLHSG